MRQARRFICSVNSYYCSDSSPCLLVHLVAATPCIYLFVHFWRIFAVTGVSPPAGWTTSHAARGWTGKLIRGSWGYCWRCSGGKSRIVSEDTGSLHRHLLLLFYYFVPKSLGKRRSFRIKKIFCWRSGDDYQVLSKTQKWQTTHNSFKMISISLLWQCNPPTAHTRQITTPSPPKNKKKNKTKWEYNNFHERCHSCSFGRRKGTKKNNKFCLRRRCRCNKKDYISMLGVSLVFFFCKMLRFLKAPRQ